MPIGLLGTLDTKGREIAFLRSCLQERGRSSLVVDVGLFEPQGLEPDIPRQEVAAAGGAEVRTLLQRPRDEVMATMGRGLGALLRRLHAEGRLEGVLGLGGNQGTAIVCAGLRQLPLGIPKLVVSTVASGNLRPYIGASDIAVLFSVADLLGGLVFDADEADPHRRRRLRRLIGIETGRLNALAVAIQQTAARYIPICDCPPWIICTRQ